MPSTKICCPKQTDFLANQTLTNLPLPLPCPVVPDTIVLPDVVTPTTYFGISMALSADGTTLIVGAPLYMADVPPTAPPLTNVTALGAVFVFRKAKSVTRSCKLTVNQFKLQQVLFSPTLLANSGFGSKVAVTADGRRILVSEPNQTVDSLAFAGAVHVFDLIGCNRCFINTQTLVAQERDNSGAVVPGAIANDLFGFTCEISGDGRVAAISSMPDDDPRVSNVYLYAFIDRQCDVAAKPLSFATKLSFDPTKTLALSELTLTPSAFGYSLSLSYNGSTLLIGDPLAANDATVIGAGYVYKRVSCSLDWSLTQVIVDDPLLASQVGSDTFVTADGSQIFLYSALYSIIRLPFTLIYKLRKTGTYELEQSVSATIDQIPLPLFAAGPVVALPYLLVSNRGCLFANLYPGSNSSRGQISLYKRCSTSASFSDVDQNVMAPTPTANTFFGASAALSGDGLTLVGTLQTENVYVYGSSIEHC